jgi:DNA-binding LacI/PurR family transcriptional regulator
VLSGGEVAQRISAETRQRVLEAASKMGYRPNLLARSLRTRKSYSIALLLPDISCGKYAKIARRIETTLHGQGYSLMLCNSGSDHHLEHEYLDMLPRKGVDGVIVVPHDLSGERLSELIRSTSVVVLDRNIEGAPCVYSDFAQGAVSLADALAQTGIENVLLITSEHHQLRHHLLSDALSAKLDIVETIQIDDPSKLKSDSNHQHIDAVVCSSSHVAEMYLTSRREFDTTRPIACFDASGSLMAMPIPVMTCNQDTQALADGVVEMLMNQLRGSALDRTQIAVAMSVKTNHALAMG